tara:strand:+ start:85 stop:2481 length:2397 start_codon:yes stop_codon:yes gene_type:complete
MNIIWFKDCSYNNKTLIGGKCASLGELYNLSTKLEFNISDGFTVTTDFYDYFIKHNNLEKIIYDMLQNIDIDDIENINRVSIELKKKIMESTIEDNILEELKLNLALLLCMKKESSVAVRSSAVAEDLPNASFAGQQDTFLNINNFTDFIISLKECIASLFNARAISYRITNQVPYHMIKIAVGVQLMVRSDIGSAGVSFSIDPETGYDKAIVINSNFGLGESVVSGHVLPDEFIVDKRALEESYSDPIIKKKIGNKESICVYAENSSVIRSTDEHQKNSFSLTDQEVIILASYVSKIEKAYQENFNCQGIDIEWALDGIDKKIYIIQARPETIHSNNTLILEKYILKSKEKLDVILEGVSVGCMITSGKVKVLTSPDQYDIFEKGDILVTDNTTPDWEPIMKKSAGIITNKGGRTCHAAIIARELKINALVGIGNATDKLSDDMEVTIDNSKGEVGYVYSGYIDFIKESISVSKDFKLPTLLMFNVGNPDNAFSASMIPNDGVGLARLEFIISNNIKIHPLAITNYWKLKLSNNKKEIDIVKLIDKIIGKEKPKDYFIKTLARDIGKIASAFYPKDVIVRLSDFKSNEYKNLIGGGLYEPDEENPMIGWRGASRYYDDNYINAFKLECEAIKYTREEMGMKNVIVMIPFCRTPEECQKVLNMMIQFGIPRGKDGMKLYLMCEVPSNVIESDRFAPMVDGVSIGGNDLLQLIIGVDRDGDRVSHLSKDTNISYRRMISKAIKDYQSFGVKVGFCGQQPSDSIEFCEFLIAENIDSMSVIPESGINVINQLGNIKKFDE